jgi:hypothetical protein
MQSVPTLRCLAACGRAFAGVPLLVLALAVPIAAQTLETGPIKVTDNGSLAQGYALKGVTGTANDAGLFGYGTVASTAINIDGVVGYVQTPQSVGVVGWAQSTGASAYGVYGYSASGPGVYGYSATGYGGAASIYGYNDGPGGTAISAYATQGTALSGSSVTGNGVYGSTTASDTNWAAILGVDSSTIGGNYAVAGQTTHGSGLAGFDYGSSGQAVYAYSNDGAEAVYAATYGGANYGTFSYNDSGSVSGWFEAGRNAGNGLIAISDFSNAGLTAAESSGIGAEVYGSSGVASAPALAAEEEIEGTYPFAAYNFSVHHPGPGPNNETFILSDTANYSTEAATNGSDVNVSGDIYVSGEVYTDCSAFPATAGSECKYNPQVRTTSAGTKLRSYSNSQSLPTMEDFGEAQLVNGQAQVTLEPAFASTIDRHRSYLVFVTPEGDCHGLYVASKTANGFAVRELMSGHSSVAFEYRIVAHPYGDGSQRLVPLTGKPASNSSHVAFSRGFNPRTTAYQQLLARSATQRAATATRGLHVPRAPVHPPLPLVKPALFVR